MNEFVHFGLLQITKSTQAGKRAYVKNKQMADVYKQANSRIYV